MRPGIGTALLLSLALVPAPGAGAQSSAAPASAAAPSADTLLRAAALRDDARVLRAALDSIHRGIL